MTEDEEEYVFDEEEVPYIPEICMEFSLKDLQSAVLHGDTITIVYSNHMCVHITFCDKEHAKQAYGDTNFIMDDTYMVYDHISNVNYTLIT